MANMHKQIAYCSRHSVDRPCERPSILRSTSYTLQPIDTTRTDLLTIHGKVKLFSTRL